MENNTADSSIWIYKQSLNESLTNCETDSKSLLVLSNILQFIHKNLDKISNEIQIADVLPILHHSLHLELQLGSHIDLGAYLCTLLDSNSNSDKTAIVVQVIFQILKTLTIEDTKLIEIGDEIFLKLIMVLKNVNDHTLQYFNANILACLQLYVNKFNAPHIIQYLWNNLDLEIKLVNEDKFMLQIFIYLFDEFSRYIEGMRESVKLMELIQHLLISDEHDHRKFAYFLLKKLFLIDSTQKSQNKNTDNFWKISITIFESLEENQSHLILPSLEQLKNITPPDAKDHMCLDVLYRQILRHNNILVRRWILEYICLHMQVAYKFDDQTLLQILSALNDTSLYNVEGYILGVAYINIFNIFIESNLFESFSQIDWKAVPLYFWLNILCEPLFELHTSKITSKELIDLAAKIRALQNVNLRREIILLFEKLFTKIISEMSLLKYVQLIEALYNVSDPFKNIELCCDKIENCNDIELDGDRVFSQRFYNIISNQLMVPEMNFQKILSSTLISKLNSDPAANWTHGFLRFLVVFDLNYLKEKIIFCQKHYGLDLPFSKSNINFQTIYEMNCQRLDALNDNEKHFIRMKTVDYILCSCLLTFKDVENYELNIDKILSLGSHIALLRITDLLAEHNKPANAFVLNCCIETLQNYLKHDYICQRVCENLLKHCQNNMTSVDYAYWMKKLVNLDNENLILNSVVLGTNFKIQFNDADFLIKGALLGDAKIGDLRIEESYECKTFKKRSKFYVIRHNYVWHIEKYETLETKATILESICAMANDLNSKRKRYYANSKEHRLMTRITKIFWVLLCKNMKPNNNLFTIMWSFLLTHNNQPNIAFIYEALVSRLVHFGDLFNTIESKFKLKNCTPAQESTLIFVLYRAFDDVVNKDSVVDLNKIITLLWPLTMGSNFQTRLNAQLIILKLIQKLQDYCNKSEREYVHPITYESCNNLKDAITKIIGATKINEFLKEIRFSCIDGNLYDALQCATNISYDEFDCIRYHHFDNVHSKSEKTITTTTETSCMPQFDVQRKINPTADFLPMSNLIAYPECNENKFYVVASLIDKIPNLGGIARTCEVLGLKNLVLDSKSHIAKADFINLSMTAEKSLNILEVKPDDLTNFLIDRRNEGFKIIGAEQTANSCSFVDFVFPSHCVLLLGHEKEGIPPNLLGFLDYAVEIPQFGMVRSLNVHVTGALFMWEYCKQHVVKKLKNN